MSREWLAVYTAMATKPKYRRLSPMGRGALLHVFILAGFQTPEATWEDPDELRESLILDGFPPGVYDELLSLGWLERLDDGAVAVHDWDAHQLAATKAARREWEARRKQDWRRQKKREPAPLSPAPPTPTRQDTTPHNKGPGHVPDMSPVPDGMGVVVAEYERLFGLASPSKTTYLGNILRRWPDPDRVIEGLRHESSKGATRRDICGRLEEGLLNGDKRQAAAVMAALEQTA